MNKLNLNFNLDSKIISLLKAVQIPNTLFTVVLPFVWIWLRPTLLEPLTYLTSSKYPFDVYKKLNQKIRYLQQMNNKLLYGYHCSIRDNRREINIIKASKIIHRTNRNSMNPEEFVGTMNRIIWYTQILRDDINILKSLINAETSIRNSLKNSSNAIRLLKALRVCCWNIEYYENDIFFLSAESKETNDSD